MYIDGQVVTLFTDHKPLVSAFYAQKTCKSDRQQRHLTIISEYINQLSYIKGEHIVVADTLSRNICAINVDPFDLPGLARSEKLDKNFPEFSTKLKEFPLSSEVTIFCDTSTSVPRPYAPHS